MQPSYSIAPTKSPDPTKAPTPPPTSAPTVEAPCGVCPSGSNEKQATAGCDGYILCTNGESVGIFSCPSGTLFDENIDTCNWAYSVTCNCEETGPSPPSPPSPTPPSGTTNPLPTQNPSTDPLIDPADSCGTCADYPMIPTTDCTGFYYCNGGEPGDWVPCGVNTLFSQTKMVCDWDYSVECLCSSPSPPGPGPEPISPPGPGPVPTPPTGKNRVKCVNTCCVLIKLTTVYHTLLPTFMQEMIRGTQTGRIQARAQMTVNSRAGCQGVTSSLAKMLVVIIGSGGKTVSIHQKTAMSRIS